MDRIDAMQAFVRVVETGSFTRAADTLQTSRTRVTQLVQQLEAHLRVKLLHRTTRKVNVTADGAAYYERVVRLLADMEDADTSLSSAVAAPRGRLRVDVPSPLASLVLIPALPAFHAQYPDIQLHLGVSDRVVDLVSDKVDCVVRGGTITNPSLIARHVGDLQLRVYAAPSYLQRAGTPEHPQALEGPHHRTVGFLWARTGQPLPFEMRRGTEHVRAQGHDICAVDDGNAYLAAGLAGLGVLWLPDYMARPHVAAGELVPLLQDWTLERSDVPGSTPGEAPRSRYTTRITGSELGLELQFDSTQPVLLQGQQGLSRKGPEATQASYYYSQPQLAVSGHLTVAGRRMAVEPGTGRACGVAGLRHGGARGLRGAQVALDVEPAAAAERVRIEFAGGDIGGDAEVGVHGAVSSLRASTTRMAAILIALKPNAQVAPSWATITPPMAGPSERAMLTPSEFSATAERLFGYSEAELLGANVREYVGFFARDERSKGFSCLIPRTHGSTRTHIYPMAGRHATLVGNAAANGNKGPKILAAPGLIVRHFAETCLRRWGVKLDKTLDLSKAELENHHNSLKNDDAKYLQMRKESYTYFTELDQGERYVTHGRDGTAFSKVQGGHMRPATGLSASLTLEASSYQEIR